MARIRTARMHVDNYSSISHVTDLANAVESLYLLLAWQTYEKFFYGSTQIIRLYLEAEPNDWDLGFYGPQEISREVGTKLVVSEFRLTHSFEIGVTGIAESIDALAEIADPLRRSERKAKLRAAEAMYRSQQRKDALEVDSNYLKVMREQIDLIEHAESKGYISPEEARQAVRNLLGQQDHFVERMESLRVDKIDAVDPPPELSA